MKKFRNRLTVVFVLLIGLSVGVLAIFVNYLIMKTHTDSLADRMTREAQLLADTIEWQTDIDTMDQWAKKYGRALDARVTFVTVDGHVLGDSQSDPRKMENHADRPEFKQALLTKEHFGESIRYSATVNTQFMYVALPVVRHTETVGVVRVAMSLSHIHESVRKIGISLVLGLLFLLMIAAMASIRLARGITQPIEKMTRMANEITRGDFNSQAVQVTSRDELGQLARAIQHMSVSLQHQLSTIGESERRLKSVIETIPSGLLLIGLRGQIRLANVSLERLLGLNAKTLVGKAYTHFAHLYALRHLIERCFQLRAGVREEVHLFLPEERVLEASLSPVVNEVEGISGVVVVLHDMTAIRRLEKIRREFVANVSHEIKTPVTSVIGFTETLLDGAMEDKETCRSFLEIINEEGKRLYRLIGDILDLSKIESRDLPLRIENTDMSRLVRRTADSLKSQVEARQQTLHLYLPDVLQVEADHDRMRQIIVNLLTNATTYTPEGGRIDLTVTNAGERWQLEVVDTGVGIPEKDIPRIFERFYRIDKARSRDSGGTGLGLAIVKHLVEVLHGTIEVQSQVGVGTTFILTFPKKYPEAHGS